MGILDYNTAVPNAKQLAKRTGKPTYVIDEYNNARAVGFTVCTQQELDREHAFSRIDSPRCYAILWRSTDEKE